MTKTTTSGSIEATARCAARVDHVALSETTWPRSDGQRVEGEGNEAAVVAEQVDLECPGVGGRQQFLPDRHPAGRSQATGIAQVHQGHPRRGGVAAPSLGRGGAGGL